MSLYHFTRDDRLKLEIYKAAGYSNAQIAEVLGFHKSSIGRELRAAVTKGMLQMLFARPVARK